MLTLGSDAGQGSDQPNGQGRLLAAEDQVMIAVIRIEISSPGISTPSLAA
jgi:hypothetical protein